MKKFSVPLFVVAALFALGAPDGSAREAAPAASDDVKALYEAKCAKCHGTDATDSFDPKSSDGVHVQAILEGRKAEEAPDMPAYKGEGVDEEKAAALVAYMRQLRAP